jgi:hypothetical protein
VSRPCAKCQGDMPKGSRGVVCRPCFLANRRRYLKQNPQTPPRNLGFSPNVVKKKVDPGMLLPRVHRDPCPRCNVRGDIGCEHTAIRLVNREAFA